MPRPLPDARCALTAPFHPYRPELPPSGGSISVALSLGSPPPDVIRRRFSVEPGLSSAWAAAVRPTGGATPTVPGQGWQWQCQSCGRRVTRPRDCVASRRKSLVRHRQAACRTIEDQYGRILIIAAQHRILADLLAEDAGKKQIW